MSFKMVVCATERLAMNCRRTAEGAAWLAQLPESVDGLMRLWSLVDDGALESGEASCSWVGAVRLPDGTRAVLKLGMPHMEGAHEIQGLRFWNGDGMVRLWAADEELGAMVLERCEPGTVLRALPEPEQDMVIAGLLRRLWRSPAEPHCFRPLSVMTEYWKAETLSQSEQWPDSGLVREGLSLMSELARARASDVLLATDLHSGNVLRASREPWLAIDPKPFVGDRAYDATQHLLNCEARMLADPMGTISRFAELCGVDSERLQLWMFARAATEPQSFSSGAWASPKLSSLIPKRSISER